MAANLSGFEAMVLTNNALVCTVNSGSVQLGSLGLITVPTTAITCAASTTTYVYFMASTQAVASATTGFPPACIPIAIVTTGASSITGIADVRSAFAVETGANFFTSSGTVTTCNATVQNITTYAIPAGLLNSAGKTIRLKAAGTLNTTAASGLQVGIQFGTTNICLINSANISTSLTNQPWSTEMVVQTVNTGATGNVFSHGSLAAYLTTNGATANPTITQDTNTAVSANVNLTGAITLAFIGLTNGAITNLNANIVTLEILN